ncbi:MAG: potassium-transporting ATPase subunit KdpC [Bacteroidetes bacterium]|nr:potassium-transporting ATPase subunit KdpC [Bacteroidota bacterium]
MKQHLRPAVALLVLFTLITGALYPLLIVGIAQGVFPFEANGSIIQRDGNPIGSALIGQQFTSAKYFWSRLSATAPFPYNAGASSGSNYGPMNRSLLNATRSRVEQLRGADSLNMQSIPVDLATASASGLDPHISIQSAQYQLSRVARERNLPEVKVRSLVEQCTESRTFGFLGEPRVNVLKLNLALDGLTSSPKGAD